MTQRDSGRYNALTDTWIDQNVKVDFAWGNIPMQPDDDRDSGLDAQLDSHIIATDGWANFPDFAENTGFPPPPPPPTINHTIAGIRKSFGGDTAGDQMYFMFLQGQNHNLFNGNTINITGSDVDAYNKNGWVVIAAVNDNAFNTNGTKVTIYWNGLITETANATTGTYAKV